MATDDSRRSDVVDAIAKTSSCIRNIALYGPFHPVVREATETARVSLQKVLDLDPNLVLVVSETGMILDNFPLNDTVESVRSFAELLWNMNVGELKVFSGITCDEISQLAEILSFPPQEVALRGGIDKELKDRELAHVAVGGRVLPREFREGGDPVKIYDEALILIEEAMLAVQSGLNIRVPEIRAVVADSLQSLMADETSLLALTNIRTYDRYLSEHSVNVCILSMVLARELGMDNSSALELGVSAMLHDVGKVFVCKDIVGKPGKLTEEEWEQMRRHPVEGARALAAMPNLPALAPTVCLEHHVYCDGVGYPALPPTQRPHLWSRLVAIVDTYDALTTDRPYRERWKAEEAIAWMMYESGNRYDRQILARFASRASLYPVGSIVRLKSGETGVVLGGSYKQPFNPRLRLIETRHDAFIPGDVIDLSTHPDAERKPVALAHPVEVLLRYTDKLLAECR